MIRSILPVGQGAFYCECFAEKDKTLNVIYDCGSSSAVRIVEREIKNNYNTGEHIDALFISHLHEDHMNGIPFLLKHCHVNKIYFPLITESNKLTLKISLEIQGVTGFAHSFLENPAQAIRDLEVGYEPEIIPIQEYDIQEYNEMDIGLASGSNVFSQITNSGILEEREKDWKYIPFNFRQVKRIEILKEKLEEQFERKIEFEELERLWKKGSKEDRDRIKKAYGKVPGKYNTNSMTLFSGVNNRHFLQSIYQLYPPCGYARCCNCHHVENGCLYMGDYDASGKQKWAQLTRAYGSYFDYIGCIQVPHHGSKYNFNPELLDRHRLFFISVGAGSRYGHPHAVVIKQFLLKGIKPFLVTENKESAIYTVVG